MAVRESVAKVAACGGMGGGMHMGVGAQHLYVNLPPGRVRRLAQLVNLLKTVVKGDWHEGEDSADECIAFGNNLIIRQTEDGQRQIAALLDGLRAGNAPQSVTVEATWIWLDAQKREALPHRRPRPAVREKSCETRPPSRDRSRASMVKRSISRRDSVA